MLKFILGIFVVLAAVASAYYYVSAKQTADVAEEQNEAALEAQLNVEKKIPAGAVMEDGTLPE